ncbi:MAG: FtsQ-type POTRA domain-containing protein [Acidimicrobiales bacterium]|nr:FtsQ-type POTRA domain-containing protein [Acidimicrobiales bacterium]
MTEKWSENPREGEVGGSSPTRSPVRPHRGDGTSRRLLPPRSSFATTSDVRQAPRHSARVGNGFPDKPGHSDKPRIDPRIAQRWIDVRREAGRRRLKLLVWAAVVTGVLAVGSVSLFTPLFEVRHVSVQVDGPMAPAQVVGLAGLAHHPLMIDVNAARIMGRLDTDPWLAAARVGRDWPDTVKLSVAVRHPVAAIAASPGTWAEVDVTGRVLADTAAAPTGLPQIQGVATPAAPGRWMAGSLGSGADPRLPLPQLVDLAAPADGSDVPRRVGAALALVGALPSAIRADVASVTVGSTTGLSLSVSPPRVAKGTVRVDFGDGSQLQAKVNAFLTILDQANLSGVGVIDVTVPDRPAALTAR